MLQDTINEPTSLDDVLANTLGWEVMEKPMFYKDLDGSTDIPSDKKITQKDAEKALEDDERKPRMLDPIIHLFHNGIGHDLEGFKGTGLALWNAITEHNNHYSGSKSTYDSRVESVLFGAGSRINEKAESAILALAK
jgi:hypothetical protein